MAPFFLHQREALRWRATMKRLFNDTRGATMAEYALLLVGVMLLASGASNQKIRRRQQRTFDLIFWQARFRPGW